MLLIIEVTVTLLLVAGLCIIVRDRLRLPTVSTIIAISSLSGHRKTVKEQFVYPIARHMKSAIKLSPYKREMMETKLKSADIAEPPEIYIASSIIISAYIFVPALILFFFLPLVSIPLMLIAVAVFLKEYYAADDVIKRRKEIIDVEIPKLAAAIAESQNYRQDVLPVLQSQAKLCGRRFRHELNLLITDMKTGNRTAALLKFESRLNSELTSQLVRGLIGIERGEDMSAYMQRMLINMKSHELSQLSKEAKKRPHELFGANTLLLIAIIIFYLVVMGMQLVYSFRTLY